MHEMTLDKTSLRKVRLDITNEWGPIFMSSNEEPLKDGEYVKYDLEDTVYYGKGYSEERAYIGRVGQVIHSGTPYKALGAGNTYEEQRANSHLVCLSWGSVAYAESGITVPNLAVVTGGPCDWLPGLEDMD